MKRFFLLAAVLVASAAGVQAGPIARLFHRGGCPCPPAGCGQPCQPAPQFAPQGVVVQTSYDGVGVPTRGVPYQPIQVGQPLPTNCGPGGCGVRQFAPAVQLFSPPMWGGFGGGCANGRCGR